jgi:hypothetical protein
MMIRFIYTLFCFSLFFNAISQDTIVKLDSSKIAILFLEIFPTEIHYKKIDNPNGPIYITDKNAVAYIKYGNGKHQNFSNNKSNNQEYNADIKKSNGKFVKFNIQLGAAVYSSYCNIRRHESYNWVNGIDEYSPKNSEKYLASPMIGISVLCGKKPFVKTYVGLNYLRSTGQYNYQTGVGGYQSVFRNFNYESKLDYLNVIIGPRFSIANRLHIEPLIALNLVIRSTIRAQGYITVSNYPNAAITTYEDKILSKQESYLPHTISFCPKISYSILKSTILEVFCSYNISFKYRLPWYMAGITYYPFKKFR